MINIEIRSLTYGSSILFFSSPSEDPLVHREHIRFNTKVTHMIETELSATLLANKLRYRLLSERCSYLFFFLKILIRLSNTNRIDYFHTLGESFRNLLLKGTKYLTNHYYRRFLGLKQDMQIVVGRRRPFGTSLPTRPCVIRVLFTRLLEPITTRITR